LEYQQFLKIVADFFVISRVIKEVASWAFSAEPAQLFGARH